MYSTFTNAFCGVFQSRSNVYSIIFEGLPSHNLSNIPFELSFICYIKRASCTHYIQCCNFCKTASGHFLFIHEIAYILANTVLYMSFVKYRRLKEHTPLANTSALTVAERPLRRERICRYTNKQVQVIVLIGLQSNNY